MHTPTRIPLAKYLSTVQLLLIELLSYSHHYKHVHTDQSIVVNKYQ